MKSRKEKIEERKQANVSDGDSRPDKQHPENEVKNIADAGKPLTKERGADINSIEDAKDAK